MPSIALSNAFQMTLQYLTLNVEHYFQKLLDVRGCGCDYMLFSCRVVYSLSLIHILLLFRTINWEQKRIFLRYLIVSSSVPSVLSERYTQRVREKYQNSGERERERERERENSFYSFVVELRNTRNALQLQLFSLYISIGYICPLLIINCVGLSAYIRLGLCCASVTVLTWFENLSPVLQFLVCQCIAWMSCVKRITQLTGMASQHLPNPLPNRIILLLSIHL